jgi:hypothetical protein
VDSAAILRASRVTVSNAWPMTAKQKKIVAIVVPIQIGLAALAWRDLAARTDDQVRGPKKLWRVLVTLNAGNSVAYWLVGRRKP